MYFLRPTNKGRHSFTFLILVCFHSLKLQVVRVLGFDIFISFFILDKLSMVTLRFLLCGLLSVLGLRIHARLRGLLWGL